MSENKFQCNVCGYYFKNVDQHKRGRHSESSIEIDLGQGRLGDIVEQSTPKPKEPAPGEAPARYAGRRSNARQKPRV